MWLEVLELLGKFGSEIWYQRLVSGKLGPLENGSLKTGPLENWVAENWTPGKLDPQKIRASRK